MNLRQAILLYYNDEDVLSETLSGDKMLKRVYKLSQKETGVYKVVISSDERTYSKEFKI